MKKILIYSCALASLLLILSSVHSLAQAERPSSGGWKGDVAGVIVNLTQGAVVPASMDVMLHGWIEDQEKIMLHDKSEPDGSFRFNGVDFEAGLNLSVMASYNDVAYFSETAKLNSGDTDMKFEVPVYETTSDLSKVKIEQMHVLFEVHGNELTVSEVYVLSNTGDRTVKDSVSLPSGRKASLRLPLPENATKVEFDSQSPDRFIQVDGGFVDTSPVLPGDRIGQVMVRYNLPFERKAIYSFTAPTAIDNLSFLIPKNSSLEIKSADLTSAGTRDVQGSPSFNVYSSGFLDAGKTIQVDLSGKIEAGALGLFKANDSRIEIAIGSGVLGLALSSVGIWWWRKSRNMAIEEEYAEEVDDVEAEDEQS